MSEHLASGMVPAKWLADAEDKIVWLRAALGAFVAAYEPVSALANDEDRTALDDAHDAARLALEETRPL